MEQKAVTGRKNLARSRGSICTWERKDCKTVLDGAFLSLVSAKLFLWGSKEERDWKEYCFLCMKVLCSTQESGNKHARSNGELNWMG